MLYFFISLAGEFLVKNDKRDRAFLRRIVAKEPQALGELYDHYNRLLFGLLLSILKKRTEAEDLLQEVFTQIWEKADQFDAASGSAYTWICTITRNKAIDRLRSKVYKEQKKQSSSLDDDDVHVTLYSSENNPLEDTILNERAKLVKQAMEQLSDKQREVIEVAYFEGKTQSEISEEFDVPLGTIKTRMRDAMIKLRTLLADEAV
ncbi:MAG: sigma-70 family RNA polymerase sigma factor [bacterium]|nr:sigma-70 family RNA polymerase sigma factor [bacterium]